MREIGKDPDRYYCKAGTSFSSSCFLLDSLMFYRKIKDEFMSTPIGNWKGSPICIHQIQSSTFHVYNIQTQENKDIESCQFYETLDVFRKKGGISKIDEKCMYDKVIDDNFVMYCLLTSEYM